MRTAPNRNATGDTVVQYLERFPHQPSRTIARLIVKEHPGLFRGQTEHQQIEKARIRVGQYRGLDKRNPYGGGRFNRAPGSPSDGAIPLPPPILEDDAWRIVPVEFRKALVIGDLHIPFHDQNSVLTALRTGRREGVDCVILAGDLMDFYAASSWERDPRLRDLKTELQTGERFQIGRAHV